MQKKDNIPTTHRHSLMSTKNMDKAASGYASQDPKVSLRDHPQLRVAKSHDNL